MVDVAWLWWLEAIACGFDLGAWTCDFGLGLCLCGFCDLFWFTNVMVGLRFVWLWVAFRWVLVAGFVLVFVL